MKSNQHKRVKLQSAVIAASAIVVMAVLAAALDQERTGTVTGSSAMTVGQTVTQSKAPTTTTPIFSPVMKAKPPKGFR
jgi:hypothetical protein